MRWPKIGLPKLGPKEALVAASFTLIFAAGGHVVAEALINQLRDKQIVDLAHVALRRLETVIDYGALSLDEFAAPGRASCEPGALQSVRLHVYQRGSVKDIRVLGRDGMVRCAAYEETLEFDKSWATRDEMLPARDEGFRVFRVEQFSGLALGVQKDIDSETSLAAIIGINSSLFDMMPGELREHSEVIMQLADGQRLARSSSAAQLDGSAGGFEASAESERYPVQAVVRVTARALAGWNREPYYPIVSISALIGILFGALAAKLINRPQGPASAIDEGLENREFQPYLQPIFNLGTGAIVGCEILARWVKPDGTIVPPVRFIQIAEEHGRIEQLTWQILRKALRDLRPVLKENREFKVSVNISPRHFMEPGFVDGLRRELSATRTAARHIVLELTEREHVEDLGRCAVVVAQLREFGVRVALDDVGIGHSGLSYMQSLGARIIKIDKFFIDSICRDASALSVVGMLVRLSRELRMNVVAEGIETSEQLSALIRCGVTEGQGYLVSPPVPADQFLTLVNQRNIKPADDAREHAVVAAVA